MAFMLGAYRLVADNVVIGVFHLKDEVREERVLAILIGGVDSTPRYLMVLAQGV